MAVASVHTEPMERSEISRAYGRGDRGRPVDKRHAAAAEFAGHCRDQLRSAGVRGRTPDRGQRDVAHRVNYLHAVGPGAVREIVQELDGGRPFALGAVTQPELDVRLQRGY